MNYLFPILYIEWAVCWVLTKGPLFFSSRL